MNGYAAAFGIWAFHQLERSSGLFRYEEGWANSWVRLYWKMLNRTPEMNR